MSSSPPPAGSTGGTPTAPRHPWNDDPDRSRTALLRDPQPRAATHMRVAENLGRFTTRRVMGKVSDINRTRVGNHPNTRRGSTDHETSGISRSNTRHGAPPGT